MASQKLKELLNEAIARELQVAIQYMWQHILWKGPQAFAVKDEFKKIAIQEMKHAELIAERLSYLGGEPTTKPNPVIVGKNLKEMIEQDIKDEENAIKLYKEIIKQASKEEDTTTVKLFEQILEDEEKHHDFFINIKEGL